MNTWFSLRLGDALTAQLPLTQINDAFEPLYAAAGRPEDMAVFTRFDSEGRLHCDVTAFFSPAAAELARTVDARPCTKPRRAELELLAGDQRSWPALFPLHLT